MSRAFGRVGFSVLPVLALMLVGSLLAAGARAQPAPERPPNIVLIFADDLGWGDVGFNGRRDWNTPHLDRLAREGTVFRRWYAAGVVCAPSRAALMTGKYGIHNGVSANNDDLPASEVTIAEALRQRGYRTALFGKWHHGRTRPGRETYVHPLDQGFDEFHGFTNAVHAWEQFPEKLWFGREERPVSGYANTLFTDRALDFVRQNRSRPFFLYLPYIATHFHIQAPPEDVAEHLGKFPEADPAEPLNATYAAMVTRMDREIGRVLSLLDDLNLADDTLVVFTSDHGATFETRNKGTSNFHDSNRPFRGQKRTLWEGGIRVPAAVRWPGRVPAGRESAVLVHMTDLFPTLLGAAGGAPRPEWKVTGLDLRGAWRGSEPPGPRTLFWEWRAEGNHQVAAMQGDLKLVVTGGNRAELFNVEEDPGERRNVAADHPETVQTLQTLLDQWLATETEESRWGKPERGR
jgi:arylsulfatase A